MRHASAAEAVRRALVVVRHYRAEAPAQVYVAMSVRKRPDRRVLIRVMQGSHVVAQLMRKRVVADRATAIDDAETICCRRTYPCDSAVNSGFAEHAEQVGAV